MKYTIERVENGYMLTRTFPGEKDVIWVYDYDEWNDEDADSLCSVLQQVVEELRPITKHNAENIYVEVRKREAE